MQSLDNFEGLAAARLSLVCPIPHWNDLKSRVIGMHRDDKLAETSVGDSKTMNERQNELKDHSSTNSRANLYFFLEQICGMAESHGNEQLNINRSNEPDESGESWDRILL